MRISKAMFLSLLLAAIPLCALGDAANPINPAGHHRGKKSGNYSLKVVGAYSGVGTSAITSTSVSISMQLKSPDGCVCSAFFDSMPLLNDRFQGTAPFNGATLTISGRLDMPAATDGEQTFAQAITGRITGNFADAAGNGGRLVAIQDAASRGISTNP
jgi:hypothetical protein